MKVNNQMEVGTPCASLKTQYLPGVHGQASCDGAVDGQTTRLPAALPAGIFDGSGGSRAGRDAEDDHGTRLGRASKARASTVCSWREASLQGSCGSVIGRLVSGWESSVTHASHHPPLHAPSPRHSLRAPLFLFVATLLRRSPPPRLGWLPRASFSL